jgi:hypothetical protein
MRSMAPAALFVLALTAAASDAAADQALGAGPVSLTTYNQDVGDCASNGNVQRVATATVTVDEHNRFVASASDTCWAYSDDHGWASDGSSLNVFAGRCGDWGCGPYASLWWSRLHDESGSWENTQCSSGFYASGPAVFFGCPSFDGQGPPMLPALP